MSESFRRCCMVVVLGLAIVRVSPSANVFLDVPRQKLVTNNNNNS